MLIISQLLPYLNEFLLLSILRSDTDKEFESAENDATVIVNSPKYCSQYRMGKGFHKTNFCSFVQSKCTFLSYNNFGNSFHNSNSVGARDTIRIISRLGPQ